MSELDTIELRTADGMLQTRSKANCHVAWGGSVANTIEQNTFSAAASLSADQIPNLCGTPRFIMLFTGALHWTVS